MSPESQRIAIAKAFPEIFRVVAGQVWWKDEFTMSTIYGPADPLSNLNAIHLVERAIWQQEKRYIRELIDLKQTPEDAIFASASQRAEALLKALNLWDDSK